MRTAGESLPDTPLRSSADFGIDPDAKEAIAFAVLAYEFARRRPGNLPSATGARQPVCFWETSSSSDLPLLGFLSLLVELADALCRIFREFLVVQIGGHGWRRRRIELLGQIIEQVTNVLLHARSFRRPACQDGWMKSISLVESARK